MENTKCKECLKNDSEPLHPCPFDEEINNCSDDVCNCCDDCLNECIKDI